MASVRSKAGDLSVMRPASKKAETLDSLGPAVSTAPRGRLVRASSFSSTRETPKTNESLAHIEEMRNKMLQMQIKRAFQSSPLIHSVDSYQLNAESQQMSRMDRKSVVFNSSPTSNLGALIWPTDVPAFTVEKEVRQDPRWLASNASFSHSSFYF